MEKIEEMEQAIKRGHRIATMLMNHCRTKITDPQEAETFNSDFEALAEDQQDTLRRLSRLRKAQDAEEYIESLRQAAKESKLEGDQCEDGSTGKKISLAEKLSSEFGESPGEGATDVVGQLRQLSAEFEANLYFLLARLASLTPESKKEVAHYEKFKSSLQHLVEDSKNETLRGILELMSGSKWQVGDSGSSKGKVDKGRGVDSLLDQVLENIQLVVFLIGEISSLADLIEECEAEQNDIDSKIKSLKGMD